MSVKTPNLREPVYHPPELRSPHIPVDNKIDIWAFGCILFEMGTQRAAFRGEEELRKFTAGTGSTLIFNFEYQGVDKKISASVRWMETVVQDIMQVNPKQRPSAESVLERLDTVFSKTK